MPTPGKIDFLIIGAQKSGTTSLFHYLRVHPQIHIPFVKEIGFFSTERKFRKGVPWYLKHFADAHPQQIIGEISPQYMAHPAAVGQIHALFPDTRLIAVLRNPIDRAYSAYRMAVRRGGERHTMQEALTPPDTGLPSNDYISMGLYGKILEGYLNYFPASQIRLVFTEELAAKPGQVMQGLLGFLGVDENFIPGNLHQQYHRDGDRKYLFLQPEKWLISKLEKLLPNQYRGWSLRFDQWNTEPGPRAELPAELRSRLAAYYKADVARLERLFRVRAPWQEFRSSGEA